MEYIEREAAMNACKEAQIKGLPQWNSGLEDALERIKNLPAGDVEERKTAQWIPSDIPNSILDKCSERRRIRPMAEIILECPFCGGKAHLSFRQVSSRRIGAQVMCAKCHARGPLFTAAADYSPVRDWLHEHAVEAWNKRT